MGNPTTAGAMLTQGAERGYNCIDFTKDLRQACVMQHLVRNIRCSAIGERTNWLGRLTKAPREDQGAVRLAKTVEPLTPDDAPGRQTGVFKSSSRWRPKIPMSA
jgi:hypothetical protein